jgi:hypothetical protein
LFLDRIDELQKKTHKNERSHARNRRGFETLDFTRVSKQLARSRDFASSRVVAQAVDFQ